MRNKTRRLLRLATLAMLLYLGAVTGDRFGIGAAVGACLVTGMVAELFFWITLFR